MRTVPRSAAPPDADRLCAQLAVDGIDRRLAAKIIAFVRRNIEIVSIRSPDPA